MLTLWAGCRQQLDTSAFALVAALSVASRARHMHDSHSRCDAFCALLRRLYIDVLDAAGQLLGSLTPLDTSSGSSLATSQDISTFCLRFNGSYRGRRGVVQQLQPGNTYRLRARLRGPLASGDKELGRGPGKQLVSAASRSFARD